MITCGIPVYSTVYKDYLSKMGVFCHGRCVIFTCSLADITNMDIICAINKSLTRVWSAHKTCEMCMEFFCSLWYEFVRCNPRLERLVMSTVA